MCVCVTGLPEEGCLHMMGVTLSCAVTLQRHSPPLNLLFITSLRCNYSPHAREVLPPPSSLLPQLWTLSVLPSRVQTLRSRSLAGLAALLLWVRKPSGGAGRRAPVLLPVWHLGGQGPGPTLHKNPPVSSCFGRPVRRSSFEFRSFQYRLLNSTSSTVWPHHPPPCASVAHVGSSLLLRASLLTRVRPSSARAGPIPALADRAWVPYHRPWGARPLLPRHPGWA